MFWKKKQKPDPACETITLPLTAFSGSLKQVHSDALTRLEHLALDLGFPLFLDQDRTDSGSPKCRRRYWGDPRFESSRSRYYAAFVRPDDDTLICELNSYARPNLVGYCAARAGTTPDTIDLVFRGLPDEPNPVFCALIDPDGFEHASQRLPAKPELLHGADPELKSAVPPSTEFVLPIPCAVVSQRIDRCLDLRRPEARRWIVRFFTSPPEGLYGDTIRALGHTKFDLSQVEHWAHLLPILIARTMGGNSFTDVFGAYLRNAGCEALIYPSARNNFHALFENGELKEFFGWNLADYRGSAAPDQVIIDSPLGPPLGRLEGEIALREVADTGSFQFSGNYHYNRSVNQVLYDQYVVSRASDWCRKHNNDELFVCGYLWYARRYSPGEQDFSVACASCAAEFTDNSVQFAFGCPTCNYSGES